MNKRTSPGFTLVELMVTLLCCALITLAAMTVLLTGTRVGRTAEDAAQEQESARMVLTLLERLAGSGQITGVKYEGSNWELLGKGKDEAGRDAVLLRYTGAGATGTLLSGSGGVVLEGLADAAAELEDDKKLLTVTVETTAGQSYTSSVYCRVGLKSEGTLDSKADVEDKINADDTSASDNTTDARKDFLYKLATQYGSKGTIQGEDEEYRGTPYAQWYNSFWAADTPWCACFLSWGAAQVGDAFVDSLPPRFAEVNDGISQFKAAEQWREPTGYAPLPGDYIFFNWDGGTADHVGVVLSVQGGTVFTLEGNSGGKVAVRSYDLSSDAIVGYGVPEFQANKAG